VRILVDYRPALRERTGVGEYVHELVRALLALGERLEVAIWTNSWRDRPMASVRRELAGATIIDRRLPVGPLTWAWNRVQWPPVEWLAGRWDLVHSQNPLLIPSSGAAGVITVHDLDFLHHPERARAEMRRDFPGLAGSHARRADAVIVSSKHAADQVTAALGVPPDRVHLCSAGAPPWAAAVRRERGDQLGGTILCLGSLEPRKNIGRLLDAYSQLAGLVPEPPPLILAGRPTAAATEWAERIARPPLAGKVEMTGYVDDDRRRALLAGARMLVMPSLEEGFGLPVLEAMACGVPVVVSNRGSLPEVAGDAASPVDPEDVTALSATMKALLDDGRARQARDRGLKRAAAFDWSASARAALGAYEAAVQRRHAHRR
jgi:glycosyltransferase involved in cell wall biosynthesis